MADGLVLNVGTGGATLATDDVGGTHYQVVKLDVGGDGVAAPVSNTNPVPVSDAGGSLTVDGTVALGAGTATFGKLAANSGVDIGDVDVTSVPTDPFGANADAASATGSISAKLRFIAATGIPITGTVTVGTHAVTQSGTWTVQPGNTANTTAWLVTGTGGSFPVTDSSGSLTVDAPVGTPVFVRLSDGAAAITNLATNVAQIAATTTATGNGTASAGCQRVTVASDNTAFSVNATSKTGTSGGYTTATGTVGATKTDIKGSAGQVYGWYFYNPNASVAYVQFFNATAANVTLGTTAPVYSLGIPASSGANVFNDHGIPHGTAISIAITTTRSGSTGPGSTVDYNIWYA